MASSLAGRRDNCLNVIRLIAAFQVFFGHACTHLQVDHIMFTILDFSIDLMPALYGIAQSIPGVPIFFFLSGFLIWDSVGRSNSFAEYVKKRFFRVYPELWVAVLIELVSILALYRRQISWTQFLLFGVGQGTLFQFWTPEFLRGYGCGTPNGSLWTITVIVQFYLVAWFLYKFIRNNNRKWWIILFTGSIALGLVRPLFGKYMSWLVYKLYGQTVFPYIWIFLTGCFAAENYKFIVCELKQYWWIAMLALVAWRVFIRFDYNIGGYGVIRSLLPCFAGIWFAYSFPRLNIKTDISYGIYIYHMIVINVMIQLGFIGKDYYLLITLAVTLAMAYASTKIVGIPGLKRKAA